jgi:hypothetical protein
VSRLVFWNPGPPDKAHPDALCDRVLGGLRREYHPRAIVMAETIGRRFQPLPGYTQVRDVSRPGRANLTVLVRDDCDRKRTWWIDMHETWTRWAPRRGQHPARSILSLSLGDVQLVAAHQPPQGTDNVYDSQVESIDALSRIMAPWRWRAGLLPPHAVDLMKARPRLLLWDPNHDPTAWGPGPKYLAHRIAPAWVHGGTTDGAVNRGGLTVLSDGMVTAAGGVAIPTDDHKGAYLLDVRLHKGMTW